MFLIAFEDRDSGETGYMVRKYSHGDYSLAKHLSSRSTGLFSRDEATTFSAEEATELLQKLADRFPPSVERWFRQPRIVHKDIEV